MEIENQSNWTTAIAKTFMICNADEHYESYSAREKMLAFTFTFLQTINTDSEKYQLLLAQNRLPFLLHPSIKALKDEFSVFASNLIFDASNTGEIQARPFISKSYFPILWNAFYAILIYWKNDTSENKEKSDVMVEKTIHFAFDILSPNAIESGIDLLNNFIKLR